MPQHGERGQIEDAQRAQPLPRAGGLVDGPLGPARMNGEAPVPSMDVFGPPSEAELAPAGDPGVLPDGHTLIPPEPDEALIALYRAHPLPALGRLLEIAGYGDAL